MQNISILQLLKTLSAASAANASVPPETKTKPASPDRAKADGEKTISDIPAVSATHARTEEEKAAYAYENFLNRHEQAVRRVQRRTEK